MSRFSIIALILYVFSFGYSGNANAQDSSVILPLQSDIWCENWLGGWGMWTTDDDIWDVGVPTYGPGSAYSDSMCAGTVLDGAYPRYADSRLISPPCTLSASPTDGALWLSFMHYFAFQDRDYGYVDISVDDGATWAAISDNFYQIGQLWTKYIIDLSVYAGQTVRFAFHIVDDGDGSARSGWYVDDICMGEGSCDNWESEDFEGEVGCWYADMGVWQIGIPTYGPRWPYEGFRCAGTVLDGAYPRYADSRLISPPRTLSASPQDGALWLSFKHYFAFQDRDSGYVEISVDNGATWHAISDSFYQVGTVWTHYTIDLSVYAGQSVRFAFHIVDDGDGSARSGWYVDDIVVGEGSCDNWESEGFEGDAGCWYADMGVWQIGRPVFGPGSAHMSLWCAGTVLNDAYPTYADSRLISPPCTLSASPADGALWLSFWHYFAFQDRDYGHVEISVDDGATWHAVSDSFYQVGGAWTKHIIDINGYAGQSVRFAFHIVDDGDGSARSGWYVDDIDIFEGNVRMLSPNFFEENPWTSAPFHEGWYASHGIWEIGIPAYGPSNAYGGYCCAATVLGEEYPRYADSRLISPPCSLSASPQDGALWLSWWHYFSFQDRDYGYAEISVDDGATWYAISDTFYQVGTVWTNYIIDLSGYTGQSVRFAFHIVDDGDGSAGSGWYVDDISVVEGPKIFNNPEGFEMGTRGWYASQGVWEIGEVVSGGPGNAFEGECCAGTVLGDIYPQHADSRLISPSIYLPSIPPGESNILSFYHYFSFQDRDVGYVEASVDYGEWNQISATFENQSGAWVLHIINITAYAGQTVRFAFRILEDGDGARYSGWYIDSLQVIGAPEISPPGPDSLHVDYTYDPPQLTWQNPAGDYDFITVYGGQNPDFIPSLGSRIAFVNGTSFQDALRPGWGMYYKISAIDSADGVWYESAQDGAVTVTAVEEINDAVVSVTKLMQNYPNPFNPTTSIKFSLVNPGHVTLNIFNAAGMRVANILDEHRKPGEHLVTFNASGLASGVYFYRLEILGTIQTRKMVLIR